MKFYLIVNPYSGGGKGLEIKKKILPVFEKSNIELDVIETTHQNHAEELAQSLEFNGYSGLCPIGGDGTMHEVINGMLKRNNKQKIPIGLITGGSGNSFMHDLDLVDPIKSAEAVINGKKQWIDVVDLNMKDRQTYIFNIIGWGLVTDAGIRAEYMRWLGTSRYTLAAAIEVIFKKSRKARLIIDDEIIDDEFLFIIGCNTKHTGKGMQMAPRSNLSDGLIDIVAVRSASRLEMFNLLPKVFDGSHIHHPKLEYFQVKNFSIETEQPDVLNLDGEISGKTSFRAQVLPNAIEVFIS